MRLLVLGPLEVTEEGGDPLPIAGSKERTVLAFLLARPQGLFGEKIIDRV